MKFVQNVAGYEEMEEERPGREKDKPVCMCGGCCTPCEDIHTLSPGGKLRALEGPYFGF